MSKTIVQKVVFKNTFPKDLYDLYMDAKKHSIATASPAKISKKEGEKFSAHGGYITGKNLQLIKDKLIVQAWRGTDWSKSDIDSTFIISLVLDEDDTILHVTHANLPDEHAASIAKGWHDYYWKPWKKYLAGKPISAPLPM
jgi:activator of HSP90 ATPase